MICFLPLLPIATGLTDTPQELSTVVSFFIVSEAAPLNFTDHLPMDRGS